MSRAKKPQIDAEKKTGAMSFLLLRPEESEKGVKGVSDLMTF